MTLQDAQQAKDNGTLVVAKQNTTGPSIIEMNRFIGKPGLITRVAGRAIQLHDWMWFIKDIEIYTPLADPNPALTEALEAISWPVHYNENSRRINDASGFEVIRLGSEPFQLKYGQDVMKVIELKDALGHLIAGMLNEVKRK